MKVILLLFVLISVLITESQCRLDDQPGFDFDKPKSAVKPRHELIRCVSHVPNALADCRRPSDECQSNSDCPSRHLCCRRPCGTSCKHIKEFSRNLRIKPGEENKNKRKRKLKGEKKRKINYKKLQEIAAVKD